jgi:hypothetical protein
MPLEGEELAHFLAARCGKLTASRMKDALATLKDGRPAKARSDLIRDLLAERITGQSVRHYVSPEMEWGLATEDEAKTAYQALTGELIGACGYYDHPRIDLFGATPDGLLRPDGLIEIKCPKTQTFIDWRMAGVIPEEHKPQMLVQMACTGRSWCEFVAFDPRIRSEDARLFIRRYSPGPEAIAAIEAAAEAFLAEVEAAWEVLTTSPQ